jgi:hypothetical protein
MGRLGEWETSSSETPSLLCVTPWLKNFFGFCFLILDEKGFCFLGTDSFGYSTFTGNTEQHNLQRKRIRKMLLQGYEA